MTIHIDITQGDDITCEEFKNIEDAKDFLEAMDEPADKRGFED